MPSGEESAQSKTDAVACAYCDSTETELFSLFGQSLIGSQYYCRNCRTVFEAVRWDEQSPTTMEGDQ